MNVYILFYFMLRGKPIHTVIILSQCENVTPPTSHFHWYRTYRTNARAGGSFMQWVIQEHPRTTKMAAESLRKCCTDKLELKTWQQSAAFISFRTPLHPIWKSGWRIERSQTICGEEKINKDGWSGYGEILRGKIRQNKIQNKRQL